jgi:hypothetical protein
MRQHVGFCLSIELAVDVIVEQHLKQLAVHAKVLTP